MSIWQRVVREKVLIVGVVTAFFGLLVAFDVPLTDVQIGSIVTFIGVVMTLLRALVTPTEEVVARQKPDQIAPQAGPAADVATGTDVVVAPVSP